MRNVFYIYRILLNSLVFHLYFLNISFFKPLMFLFSLLSIVLARQVEINPSQTFEFADLVSKGDIYKFKYSTMGNVLVTMKDPLGRIISEGTTRSSALFTKLTENGKITISVKNESKELINLSYKSPDPNKEVLGHLGYIKEVDKVTDLAKLLDKLLADQAKQLNRTKEHQALVSKCHSFSRALLIFEAIGTAIGVYLIHKDFISIFEKKQVV